MSLVPGLLIPLAILAGLIALGVRAWRGRGHDEEGPSAELIPYLLLALAVGVAVFSLAELAAAALVPERIAGQPAARIASSLAGIVVAGPISLLIWRRQADRRQARPEVAGWPVYLGLVELVFLSAFFVAVGEVAAAWFGREQMRGVGEWTDLVVFGGVVGYHWWARRREPPQGEIGGLPLVLGSAVSLVALATGLAGALDWLFSLPYPGETVTPPDPASPLALTVLAAPVWAWIWLREGRHDPRRLTSFYMGTASVSGLTTLIGSAVAILGLALGFVVGQGARAETQFQVYPTAFALLIVGGAVWYLHRLGESRRAALQGYRYAMAAVGLAALIGTGTALVDAVFRPRLVAGGQTLITTGLAAVTAGVVWWWFWQQVEAVPRPEQVSALPRRIYLVGGSVVTGLVAAGALIGTLVIVFTALLGGEGGIVGQVRVPATLTVLSGLALWHLVLHLRADNAIREETAAQPFTVTVVCSDPGPLADHLPHNARLRLLPRGDDLGVVDGEMAAAIVGMVANRASLVWIDETGFRVAPAGRS